MTARGEVSLRRYGVNNQFGRPLVVKIGPIRSLLRPTLAEGKRIKAAPPARGIPGTMTIPGPNGNVSKRFCCSQNLRSRRESLQLAHLADATEARTLVRDLNQTYDRLGRAPAYRVGGRWISNAHAWRAAPWLAKLGYLPPAVGCRHRCWKHLPWWHIVKLSRGPISKR